MATAVFAAVDEGYNILKIKSFKDLVNFCEGYTTRAGEKFTSKVVKAELESEGCLRLFEYDEDELEEAKELGSVRGKDWEYRIERF
jgi:hypothetical protein